MGHHVEVQRPAAEAREQVVDDGLQDLVPAAVGAEGVAEVEQDRALDRLAVLGIRRSPDQDRVAEADVVQADDEVAHPSSSRATCRRRAVCLTRRIPLVSTASMPVTAPPPRAVTSGGVIPRCRDRRGPRASGPGSTAAGRSRAAAAAPELPGVPVDDEGRSGLDPALRRLDRRRVVLDVTPADLEQQLAERLARVVVGRLPALGGRMCPASRGALRVHGPPVDDDALEDLELDLFGDAKQLAVVVRELVGDPVAADESLEVDARHGRVVDVRLDLQNPPRPPRCAARRTSGGASGPTAGRPVTPRLQQMIARPKSAKVTSPGGR